MRCSVFRFLISAAGILASLCATVRADDRTISVENAILKTIQSADIAAQVSGIVTRIHVREGDRVALGAVLASMQDEAVRLQVEKARIALETAKLKAQSNIDLEVATKGSAVAMNELQRALQANRRVVDTYPKTEVDRLQLVADRSLLEIKRAEQAQSLTRMDVQSAENELRIAEELANRHRLLSPCEGTVVAVDKHPGEWVELGGRLLQIVSTEKLRIEGFIDVGLAEQSIVGAEAEVVLIASSTSTKASQVTGREEEPGGLRPSALNRAKVMFVGSEANPVNGKVRVFLEIENPQGKLHPGRRVEVRIRPTQP